MITIQPYSETKFRVDNVVARVDMWYPMNFDPTYIGRIDSSSKKGDSAFYTVVWFDHALLGNRGITNIAESKIMRYTGLIPKFKIGQEITVFGMSGQIDKAIVKSYDNYESLSKIWTLTFSVGEKEGSIEENYVVKYGDPKPEWIKEQGGSPIRGWYDLSPMMIFGTPQPPRFPTGASQLDEILSALEKTSIDEINPRVTYTISTPEKPLFEMSGAEIIKLSPDVPRLQPPRSYESPPQLGTPQDAWNRINNDWGEVELTPMNRPSQFNTRPVGSPHIYQNDANGAFEREPLIPELGVRGVAEEAELTAFETLAEGAAAVPWLWVIGGGILGVGITAGLTYYFTKPRKAIAGILTQKSQDELLKERSAFLKNTKIYENVPGYMFVEIPDDPSGVGKWWGGHIEKTIIYDDYKVRWECLVFINDERKYNVTIFDPANIYFGVKDFEKPTVHRKEMYAYDRETASWFSKYDDLMPSLERRWDVFDNRIPPRHRSIEVDIPMDAPILTEKQSEMWRIIFIKNSQKPVSSRNSVTIMHFDGYSFVSYDFMAKTITVNIDINESYGARVRITRNSLINRRLMGVTSKFATIFVAMWGLETMKQGFWLWIESGFEGVMKNVKEYVFEEPYITTMFTYIMMFGGGNLLEASLNKIIPSKANIYNTAYYLTPTLVRAIYGFFYWPFVQPTKEMYADLSLSIDHMESDMFNSMNFMKFARENSDFHGEEVYNKQMDYIMRQGKIPIELNWFKSLVYEMFSGESLVTNIPDTSRMNLWWGQAGLVGRLPAAIQIGALGMAADTYMWAANYGSFWLLSSLIWAMWEGIPMVIEQTKGSFEEFWVSCFLLIFSKYDTQNTHQDNLEIMRQILFRLGAEDGQGGVFDYTWSRSKEILFKMYQKGIDYSLYTWNSSVGAIFTFINDMGSELIDTAGDVALQKFTEKIPDMLEGIEELINEKLEKTTAEFIKKGETFVEDQFKQYKEPVREIITEHTDEANLKFKASAYGASITGVLLSVAVGASILYISRNGS